MKIVSKHPVLVGTALFALAAGALYGCRDFLTNAATPQGTLNETTLLTRSGVEGTLIGAYRTLDCTGNTNTNWGCAAMLRSSIEDPRKNPFASFLSAHAKRETFLSSTNSLGGMLVQEMNYTNAHVRGCGFWAAVVAKQPRAGADLLLGFGDTMLLGDRGNPWVVTLRAAFRGEPSERHPANPAIVGSTALVGWSARRDFVPFVRSLESYCKVLPLAANFEVPTTASNLDQEYTSFVLPTRTSFSASMTLKSGWQFL